MREVRSGCLRFGYVTQAEALVGMFCCDRLQRGRDITTIAKVTISFIVLLD
jgi:hypothetical protein